jgi:hypothetical protein
MMAVNLASLSLFVATPEQIAESRRRAFAQWGSGMTIDQYLECEAFLNKFDHARDGKLITWYVERGETP